MPPRDWREIPAEQLFESAEWRRISDTVLTELGHVLIAQAPHPYRTRVHFECHPARMIELAKQIEHFPLN